MTQVPAGFALMRHADTNASIVGGSPDGDGNTILPLGMVDIAEAHGFALVDPNVLRVKEAESQKDQKMADMAAQMVDMEKRLATVGAAAEQMAAERDTAIAERDTARKRVAELEAAMAAIDAAQAEAAATKAAAPAAAAPAKAK